MAMLALALTACQQPPDHQMESKAIDTADTAGQSVADNPLLSNWGTDFGVPPFDTIEAEDYLPALRIGIAEQQAEIDAIVGNREAPTFANTIEALERSGSTLSRVVRVFYAVNGAHANEVTRDTARTIAPELSAHRDNITLNADLFERVDAVYRKRGDLGLTDEQLRLLSETHKDFVRAGVNLEEESRAKLRELNAELATLAEAFRNNLQKDSNRFELLVTDRADLGELPESLVGLAAEEAERRGTTANAGLSPCRGRASIRSCNTRPTASCASRSSKHMRCRVTTTMSMTTSPSLRAARGCARNARP